MKLLRKKKKTVPKNNDKDKDNEHNDKVIRDPKKLQKRDLNVFI